MKNTKRIKGTVALFNWIFTDDGRYVWDDNYEKTKFPQFSRVELSVRTSDGTKWRPLRAVDVALLGPTKRGEK